MRREKRGELNCRKRRKINTKEKQQSPEILCGNLLEIRKYDADPAGLWCCDRIRLLGSDPANFGPEYNPESGSKIANYQILFKIIEIQY